MSDRGGEKRPHRAMLTQYYGQQKREEAEAAAASHANSSRTLLQSQVSATASSADGHNDEDPLNLNGPNFDADLYTQKLIKEASLTQLMNREGEIVRQIGCLDSDMQTLVYENYNKFIAATETIKKMRVDFRAMEDEMDQLASKMQNITVFSGQVTDTLRDRRQRIGQLSGTHALLKKLQFLFELPAKLNECIAEDDLATGVKYYLRAQRVLDQYEHMNSFKGIKGDCDGIMEQLREKLISRLRDPETPAEDLSTCVNLLLRLQEPADRLCDTYLATAKKGLDESLDVLARQVKMIGGQQDDVRQSEDGSNTRPSDAFQMPMDILEFVDYGCNTFLSDLCLVIASFREMFLQQQPPTSMNAEGKAAAAVVDEKMASDKLATFVSHLIKTFLDHLRSRLRQEKKLDETAVRVRALDRFHRRLQAMSRLLPSVDFSRAGLDLVLEASEIHCSLTLEQLKSDLQESLVGARHTLVAPPQPRRLTTGSDAADGEVNLRELNLNLLSVVAEKIREQLTNLQLFIDPELTFAVKTYFRAKFCREFVREKVLVAFFDHIREVAQGFCNDAEKTTAPPPPMLLLLLSRTCFDLQLNTTQYLLNLVDEQFFIDDCSNLTSVSKVNDSFRIMSQLLLNRYVKAQGGVISQMLRKSVETRDWLNTVEPRTVRAVMKRVVEETTTIDRQVGQVYEEGARQARSSDSRRTRFSQQSQQLQQRQGRSNWSVSTSQLDTSLASNIQKMFNEKIVIFSKVEFSRVSILTGIVKIALKTLLECVRLRTFSRFGFQQIQVDVHYLHLYLWRFVSDENLVIFLLDEIMTSAVHRCADPVPMENSVIDVILQ